MLDQAHPSTASGRRSARVTARTVGAILLLQLALPVNVAVTWAALLRALVTRPRPGVAPNPKTILISGGKMTKALQLARSFHRAGHRVVLVETAKYRLTGHRFSRAVDRFYTVPAPQDDTYVQALLDIVRTEGVDVYVPVCSPVSSRADAAAKKVLSAYCEVLHPDEDAVARLDDKYEFALTAQALGLPVPDTHLVTAPQQVADFDFDGRDGTYVLKSIAYDPEHRLDLTPLPRPTRSQTAAFAATKPISADNPWILQEFVDGQEYCTHATVREGRVQVYCCCESSAFQLNYEMADQSEIKAWVHRFVGALGLTGQVSFDFIRAEDGSVRAIECNPRTHSAITMFYDHPDLARAYLETGVPAVEPTPASRPTYWLYHELWRLLSRPAGVADRLRTIRRGKEAIFDWDDPLPFLLVHHVQIPWLLLQNLRRGRDWIRVDFNIGKLVEPAGD